MDTNQSWKIVWFVMVIAMTGCATRSVQLPATPVPPTVIAIPQSIWDGIFTEHQVVLGKTAYENACAECHMSDLSGHEMASPLVGAFFAFRWRDKSIATLFENLRTTMPQTAPGSLGDQEYFDIIAFLLDKNGYPDGNQTLGSDVERLNFYKLERPNK